VGTVAEVLADMFPALALFGCFGLCVVFDAFFIMGRG
jgi:hypothetical protein